MIDELHCFEKKHLDLESCPKKNGRYVNPHIDTIHRRWVDYLLWQVGHFDRDSGPRTVPKEFSYPNPHETPDLNKPTVSWINHSSFHLNYLGVNFLTDPILARRCSPVPFLGPKRKHAPSISVDKLSEIDFVLVSHNHYDHLDKETIKIIAKNNPMCVFVAPLGVKKLLVKLGCMHVIELGWWDFQEISISQRLKIRFTATPSQHFSGRGLLDGNKTLWCGFALEFFEDLELVKKFYFVGDTGYNPYDFKTIGETFGGFDLSLIPIGTYLPYQFMAPVHICPEKAVAIHQDVKSKLSLGMHWKTFKLSDEELHAPPYDLYVEMNKANLDPMTFRALDPGQVINW